jgi:hypothetical protein
MKRIVKNEYSEIINSSKPTRYRLTNLGWGMALLKAKEFYTPKPFKNSTAEVCIGAFSSKASLKTVFSGMNILLYIKKNRVF